MSKSVYCDPPADAPPAGIRMQRYRWFMKCVQTSGIGIAICSVVANLMELKSRVAASNWSRLIREASPSPKAATSSAGMEMGW
mmetsp:Transcript_43676/g.92886  ORF Transcript_43676/g.92886 Transcript_43676/m.92886 type:complete len:83 (+) Transcript_43676:365-613(+)